MTPRTTIEPKDARVLIVEDNFNNYRLITRLLALLDVPQCEWKTSGSQVVEFADALPRVDLILMDIHLPVEDGYQVLTKLREHPRFADTRIIAVTAEATESNLRRAREEGFDGFIGKPISPSLFPEQILKIFQGGEVWDL
jgi:two-component system cell cycle response regulator DivK